MRREEFLAKARARRGTVEFEDGTTFMVRGMTAKEISMYTDTDKKTDAEKNADVLKQFAMCVINPEDGSQIFDPDSTEDIEAISGIGFDVVSAAVQKVTELSGLKAKLEDAVKN